MIFVFSLRLSVDILIVEMEDDVLTVISMRYIDRTNQDPMYIVCGPFSI